MTDAEKLDASETTTIELHDDQPDGDDDHDEPDDGDEWNADEHDDTNEGWIDSKVYKNNKL